MQQVSGMNMVKQWTLLVTLAVYTDLYSVVQARFTYNSRVYVLVYAYLKLKEPCYDILCYDIEINPR